MRVLIVNTSERTGGAAVAAGRLVEALNNSGVKARMLVRDKQSDAITVVDTGHRWWSQWCFLWERLVIFCHLFFRRDHLYEIDIANIGTDITRTRAFKEADVIHLSWINQGFLSLKTIGKILASGKPVVWTMHDLWPASSICHYAHGCQGFRSGCHNCKLLPHGGNGSDLSAKVWKRKADMLRKNHIWFVSCSRWLETQAKQSALLRGQSITSIPNPINTEHFHPTDKAAARRRLGLPVEGRIILFASQRVTDTRKGISYLIEAVEKLAQAHPDMKETTSIALLGGHAEELERQLALPVHALGYISDEKTIIAAYSAADVFVIPSLEDNLPNTIMEAMACGVPCVGFRVGGIPEMIDHQVNGYVAQSRDAADLAEGIAWVLDAERHAVLSEKAVDKVMRSYSQRSVAMRYIDVYNEALATKHYRL